MAPSSFFFNDTTTPEIYTLSLHDALPIFALPTLPGCASQPSVSHIHIPAPSRSEEHTSELQSQSNLVCRLLLEKKNPEIVERLVKLGITSVSVTPDSIERTRETVHTIEKK